MYRSNKFNPPQQPKKPVVPQPQAKFTPSEDDFEDSVQAEAQDIDVGDEWEHISRKRAGWDLPEDKDTYGIKISVRRREAKRIRNVNIYSISVNIDKSIIERMAFNIKSDKFVLARSKSNMSHFKLIKSKSPNGYKIAPGGTGFYYFIFSAHTHSEMDEFGSTYVRYQREGLDTLVVKADEPI